MDEQNLAELFHNRSQRYEHLIRWKQRIDGIWKTSTYAEHKQFVYAIMAGLIAQGAQPGDKIGIMANTSYQWLATDWASWALGGATVTIYPTLMADTTAFIVNDAEVKFLFVDDKAQIEKLSSVRGQLEGIEKVIAYDSTDLPEDPWIISFDQLQASATGSAEDHQRLAEENMSKIKADDVATIVYTSGTTGNPKGAMLTHNSFIKQLDAMRVCFADVYPGDVDLMFLPAAHIFGRVQHVHSVDRGLTAAVVASIKDILVDIKDAQPTFFFSVPRIYEKIFSGAKAAAELSPVKSKIFHWAVDVGRKVSHVYQEGNHPSGMLKMQQSVADRLVFKKVRNLLGGNIRYAITGGAPLDSDILEFFNGAGVRLLEGWGLTETTAAATVNQPNNFRIGTVGKPLQGVEIKIANDGEILVRGPQVMSGYYNSPEKSAEAIVDEWFHTGDIGELDSDGFLKITDRKKDIIVTAGGKNIAPQAVEAAFKNSPYISQCAVYGDRRPYLVAVLTLDPESMTMWANQEGITVDAELTKHPKVQALIKQEVATANTTLPSFEQIKYYEILPEDFSVENGLLTPTLKLRRRYIYDEYRDTFEGLYT